MNNKNNNAATNVFGNKTIIIREIIKVLIMTIMIIIVIIKINNSNL